MTSACKALSLIHILGYIDRTDPEHWLEYEVSFRVTKKTLPDIISRCMTRNGTRNCAKMLDAIKAQGYKYSTLSAISSCFCGGITASHTATEIADRVEYLSLIHIFGQNVHLRLEGLVGVHGTGLSQNLTTLDLGTICLLYTSRCV